MRKFDAAAFHDVLTSMARTLRWLEIQKESNPGWTKAGQYGPAINERLEVEVLIERATTLRPLLEQIGAGVTLAEVERHIKELRRGWIYQDFLLLCYQRIIDRLTDELRLIYLYGVEAKNVKYLEPKEPLFGKDFQSAFPSAAFELDEAGKCLALDRSTASVFHLMRMMEIGLRAMSACLALPPPTKAGDRNWGSMLRAVNASIEAKTKAGTWRGDDKATFAELYASLEAVRIAWRNATMHVENKYTDDEAEHIFITVKGFMKKLASRCDENGIPLA
jgi:hypothetical protein